MFGAIGGINFLGQIKTTNTTKTQEPKTKPMECDCFIKTQDATIEKVLDDAKQKIMQEIAQNNVEYGFTISKDGEILQETRGDEHSCTIDSRKIKPGSILLHGHPTKLPLSSGDIAVLLATDAAVQEAVTSDGCFSRLTKTPEFINPNMEYVDLYAQFEKELCLMALEKMGIDCKLNHNDVTQMAIDYLEKSQFVSCEGKSTEEIWTKARQRGINTDATLEEIAAQLKERMFFQLITNPTKYDKEHNSIINNSEKINRFFDTEEGIETRHEFVQTVADKYGLKYETDMLAQNSGDNFIHWADNTDFLSRGIYEALNDENIIGKGFTSVVYQIPGNQSYVLRTARTNQNIQSQNFGEYRIVDTEDKNLKSNFGQRVAWIENTDYSKPRIGVLKKQKGFANANPPSGAIYYEDGRLKAGELPYEDRQRKEHYARSMQALADMPQEAYDTLIEELIESGEAGYAFDSENANNFLLDEEGKRINIIDLGQSSCAKLNDNFGNILCALTNIEYLSTYKMDGDEAISEKDKDVVTDNIVIIIDKYLKALKHNGVKLDNKGARFMTEMLACLPMGLYLETLGDDKKLQKLRDMGVME